jgi:hypothetical protein
MRIYTLLLTTFLFVPALVAHAATVDELIAFAGNAPSDAVRLVMLHQLSAHPDITDLQRDEAKRFTGEVARYLDPGKDRMYYFDKSILDQDDYDFGVAPDSPLYPLTHLYRARMLAWVTLEYGGYWKDPEVRRARLDKVRTVFEHARDAFPEEPLARMYLGEIVSPPSAYIVRVGAPLWAVAQREGLERLTDIIHWWIDHRQREDGQYGGGWGDDCEMWRFWPAILMGFEDPKIRAAQEKLSRALLDQEHMRGGYTRNVHDVEHTSEDSSDVLTPMLHLAPDSAEWARHSMRLVELSESLWMGRNARGLLQYKSTYFSVDSVDESAKRACDTVYHPRVLQPVSLLWQRSRDPMLTRLFSDWMDTWVDAAAREERGKPAGVIPSAIHWPDGAIGGVGEHWWDPENHDKDPLYVFPSAMSQMTHLLLLTWHVTRDEKYLGPIRSMAAIRRVWEQDPVENPEPGSALWCGMKMGEQSSVLSKYRMLSGSTEFDAMLGNDAPYARYLFHGEEKALLEALQRNAVALGINFPGYTSEVRYTDRVLRFPSLFGENGIYPDAVAGIDEPDPMLLYASVTGDPGTPAYFPLNAVRWLTPARNIAALVTASGPDQFRAKLYHFGNAAREMGAEFHLLEPGDYRLDIAGEIQTLKVTGPRTVARFTLPPMEEVELRVERIEP